MALDLSVSRPKLAQTVAVDCDITVGTPVESDGTGSIFIPFQIASQDPPSFTVASCTTTSGSAVVTTSVTNGFANTAVGDVVSGTGVAGGSTVLSKQSNTQVTLSANATASGTVTLTFDPPSVTTPTFLGLNVTFSTSGGIVTPSVTLHKYDGSLKATTGSAANSTSSVTLSGASSLALDYDSFLTTLRVFRTNS